MKVIETKIPGVLIVETDVFGDHRGYFTETYSKPKYEKLGITVDFVQDNMSFSAQKGTLRGLHWQNPPYARNRKLHKREISAKTNNVHHDGQVYRRLCGVDKRFQNKRRFP
mgnify:CR=1 FL=1